MNQTINKRKVLLITPDYMDYTAIMHRGIMDELKADTFLITSTGNDLKLKYRDSFHRVQNFFSKLILNRNQKKIFYTKTIHQKLALLFNEHPYFDDILILRPDLIKAHLPFIKKHAGKLIAYFWDSFSRFPGAIETIQYFDRFYSFEPKDVKEHGLFFLPNFYYPGIVADKNKSLGFDLSYIASYDKRFATMEKIFASLKPLNLSTNIQILAIQKVISKNRHKKDINWLHKPLSLAEVTSIVNESKCILDIAQPEQEGLSFRIIEALKLEKKIITTNRSITSYDFYDPNNVFVWENTSTIPSRDFFTTLYTSLSHDIIRNYSLEYWVRKIFQ